MMRPAHVSLRVSLRVVALAAGTALLACSASPDTDEVTPSPPGESPGEGSSSGGTAPSASPPPSDGGASSGDAGSGEEEEPESPPMVQLVGRFDTRDPERPVCAYPGCRIVARFEGTRVSARLDGIVYSWMEGAPSEWDVVVDGAARSRIIVGGGIQDFELATDLAPGVHTVELYKRTEAQTGAARFLGFDLHGGTLRAPPRRPKRHIEIVGDSQPAAFGVEGTMPCTGINWSGQYQNFARSFGAVLGARFGAEVYGTVYSGKGVVRNIWVTDDETMPMLFLRANPLDPTSTWDFGWRPHVVVVMLGGNDFAFKKPYDDAAPPSPAAFTAGYDAFVGVMRSRYPDAHIVLATSPSVKDAEPAGRSTRTSVVSAVEAIVTRRRAGGDERVVAAAPSVATPDELTGCDGHGTPAFHARVAAELAAVIAPRLGW